MTLCAVYERFAPSSTRAELVAEVVREETTKMTMYLKIENMAETREKMIGDQKLLRLVRLQ